MKKFILLLLICAMFSLCGCYSPINDILFGNDGIINQTIPEDDDIYKTEITNNADEQNDKEEVSTQKSNTPDRTVPAELVEYEGTWYGFGTDGNSASTNAKFLEFLDATRVKFNDRVYVLTFEYTAESIDYVDNETGIKNSKYILEFGKNSIGELALNTYVIKKPSFDPVSQYSHHYRQSQKSKGLDFEKGKGDNKVQTNSAQTTKQPAEIPASPQQSAVPAPSQPKTDEPTDPTPYVENPIDKKMIFQQRYNALAAKQIDDSHQVAMNTSSYDLFMEWDLLLNDIYKYLKTIKTAEEFKVIENDEINWIVEKEAAIEASRKLYEGGSMAPLAGNTTGIEYTKERCAYLISLIG